MSAISGVINIKSSLNNKDLIKKMTEKSAHRGKNGKYSEYISNSACFASYSKEDIPHTKILDGIKYTILYDGEIYNIDDAKSYLNSKCCLTGDESDAEIILILYHILGNAFLKKLNGVFVIAIWNEEKSELILARDRFGVKPLYYSIVCDTLIFSSEIKGILSSGYVDAELDKSGLCHIFGIGPAIEQGYGILKNISELLPASMACFNRDGFREYKYWNIKSERHTDSFEDTVDKVYDLTACAIKNQVKKDNGKICCFLSGGLDSSIITSIAAENFSGLNTFSVEYSGNSEHFTPNEYQPNSDSEFIKLMSETYGTNHTVVEITSEDLKNELENAMIARDHPGMGDVDSSLYCFCKIVGENFDNAMSGECADEVFGGYPWFHRKEDFDSNTFPWSKNTDLRNNIINQELFNQDELSSYINTRYNTSIAETPEFFLDSKEEKRRREISYLNLNWFMYSLGERSERIGMYNGLNIRMPFCDYKLVEYVWNIPWEFKAHGNREKGLLRKCFTGKLPEDIVFRKKSPYPKTHNPIYEELIKDELLKILSCSDRRILKLINKEYVLSLINEKSDYAKPWFGQLMALPQLYSYLIQLDFWLENYNIKF